MSLDQHSIAGSKDGDGMSFFGYLPHSIPNGMGFKFK